jgi:hypothetical protein
MLEKWELANYKPEHNFVVRRYMIGKGHSVSVLGGGGESVRSSDLKPNTLSWIREKSQAWLLEQKP